MSNSINLICGPSNNEKLLSLSIPENTDPLTKILVGFTGGMDSSFLLYLLAMLNSTHTIPYIIQPISISSAEIHEQWQYINPIIDYINDKTGQSISNLMYDRSMSEGFGTGNIQVSLGYIYVLKTANYNSSLYLGTTALPPTLNPTYARNFPKFSRKIMQPFSNLDKSHIVDAMIKLNLEGLIEILPKCTTYHKYGNEACYNFFCTERRWAYSILNRPDLTNKFIGNDT